MLVLSRKSHEEIILRERSTGREIGRVVLVEQRANGARLGFEFGREIEILRAELIDGPVSDQHPVAAALT